MTQFNWQRLDNGAWGVKESGDFGRVGKLSGKTISVRKRDGSSSQVVLGRVVATWNGRAAVYTVEPSAVHSTVRRADIRIEYPSVGRTYSRDVYGVYEYGVYSRSSVLAGQESRSLLGQFNTLAEARAEFPHADVTGIGYRDIEVGVTPPAWFDPDAAGERWDDES